ncbi:hypothetical protein E1809_24780 [Arthrobacter terricola]|uniref:Uncharacterized protein n=1 Tax=Arthrobacter terricola TaxID=2547396 RepID=A0A4R5K7V2_9MICC|nr:hypothetical protein E1809_24780 [Arthrobacter terricola]
MKTVNFADAISSGKIHINECTVSVEANAPFGGNLLEALRVQPPRRSLRTAADRVRCGHHRRRRSSPGPVSIDTVSIEWIAG